MNQASTRTVREPTFLILTALVSGSSYGYQLIQTVEELSNGRIRLNAGTVYAALERLVGDGTLSVDRQVVNGQTRRCYSITARGRDELLCQVHRLEANAALAREQMGMTPIDHNERNAIRV